MRIGVPTEIKVHEYRVGLVPAAAKELVALPDMRWQSSPVPARGVGCSDDDYRARRRPHCRRAPMRSFATPR